MSTSLLEGISDSLQHMLCQVYNLYPKSLFLGFYALYCDSIVNMLMKLDNIRLGHMYMGERGKGNSHTY